MISPLTCQDLMSKLDIIISDCERYVLDLNRRPFNGHNVGGCFGKILAMIQALAKFQKRIIYDIGDCDVRISDKGENSP